MIDVVHEVYAGLALALILAGVKFGWSRFTGWFDKRNRT